MKPLYYYNTRIENEKSIGTLVSVMGSTDHDKQVRVDMSKNILECHERGCEVFLQQFITYDEMWLYFFDPKTNAKSWSPSPKKSKSSEVSE